MRIRKLLHRTLPNALAAITAGTALVLSSAVLPGAAVQAQGATRDYSANSIVNGGTLTPQEFVTKARANNPNDIQAVYSAYGLTPEEYDRFLQNAKMGVAHKNGDIVVDGRVVARNSTSLGRERKPNSTARNINGHTYYETSSQNVFAQNTIPVIVLFDDQGRYESGVLTACANPIRGTAVATPRPPAPAPVPVPPPAPVTPVEKPVTPSYNCEYVRGTRRANGTDLQYDFTVQASHTNARVSHVDFDFGDGTARPGVRPGTRTAGSTTTDPYPSTYTTPTTTYTTPTTTAPSTTYNTPTTTYSTPTTTYSTPSTSTTTTTTGTSYDPNTGTTTNTSGMAYDYATGRYYDTRTGTTTSGTTATTTTNGTTPATTGRTNITTDHDYAQHGTYTVRATVHFDADGAATSAGSDYTDICDIRFTTQRTVVTPAATPPVVTPPPTLPATGVGEYIALFTAVSVLGSAGYYLYTKRRLAGF